MQRRAVYDRILLSATKPTGQSTEAWIASAPAWANYAGEVDNGVLVHHYGPHDMGKLTLRYHLATERLTVAGSLHSFRYGHNSGLFPFAEVEATCQAIADALQLPPEALRVHVLETGVSVALTEAPTDFLSQLRHAHYGPLQVPFYAKAPPAGCAQPLLYTASFEQYRIKAYDVGAYNRIRNKPAPPGPALRFEKHYRKAKKAAAVLGWNGNLTLANLMQPDVFTRLAEHLIESWHHIHLPPELNTMTSTFSLDETALLVAGNMPGFWERAKLNTPTATYKRKRALFHRLQRQVETDKALPYTAQIEDLIRRSLPD